MVFVTSSFLEAVTDPEHHPVGDGDARNVFLGRALGLELESAVGANTPDQPIVEVTANQAGVKDRKPPAIGMVAVLDLEPPRGDPSFETGPALAENTVPATDLGVETRMLVGAQPAVEEELVPSPQQVKPAFGDEVGVIAVAVHVGLVTRVQQSAHPVAAARTRSTRSGGRHEDPRDDALRAIPVLHPNFFIRINRFDLNVRNPAATLTRSASRTAGRRFANINPNHPVFVAEVPVGIAQSLCLGETSLNLNSLYLSCPQVSELAVAGEAAGFAVVIGVTSKLHFPARVVGPNLGGDRLQLIHLCLTHIGRKSFRQSPLVDRKIGGGVDQDPPIAGLCRFGTCQDGERHDGQCHRQQDSSHNCLLPTSFA